MGRLAAWSTAFQSATSEALAGLDPDSVALENLRHRLIELDVRLLEALSCSGHEVELAYQLGRSLRDTASAPGFDSSDAQEESLRHLSLPFRTGRVAKIQQWLQILGSHFDHQAASVVSESVGQWQSWVRIVVGGDRNLKPSAVAGPTRVFPDLVHRQLLDQGDVWRDVLAGVQSTKGLLTPEAYVVAAERALNRTTRIVRRVILHYSGAFLLLLVAVVGAFWASSKYAAGSARVWTDIATGAGALGVSFRGVGASLGRLAEVGERPVFRAAEVDGKAWAITTLPRTPVSRRQRRELMRAKVNLPKPRRDQRESDPLAGQ